MYTPVRGRCMSAPQLKRLDSQKIVHSSKGSQMLIITKVIVPRGTIVCKAHASLKVARLILNVEQDLFVMRGLAYLLCPLDGQIDPVGVPMNVLAATCNVLKKSEDIVTVQ